MEYIFCLLSPLEHTLEQYYVFLFILKYIGRMFYKIKDKGVCKKTNLILRRLDFTVPASMKTVLLIFSQNHRMVWDGKDIRKHLVPAAVRGAVTLSTKPGSQSSVKLSLVPLQRWIIHTFYGQPLPVPYHPLSNIHFKPVFLQF